MAGLSLATAEAKLQEYLDAETAVLSGQSYTIKDRSLTRADLKDIREGIVYWNDIVRSLNASTSGRGRSISVSLSGR